MKRQPASKKRSKRAFRKSTDRSVARLIATMLSRADSGAGSLWAAVPLSAAGAGSTPPGGGSLGSLAGRDTAPWGELAGMGALRRRQRAQSLLRDLRERDEIDVGAAARRARHEREALVAQAERLEDVEARG